MVNGENKMKILVGTPAGKGAKIAKSLDMGYMITCSTSGGYDLKPTERVLEFPYCALDNGAYGNYIKGDPFDGDRFLRFVDRINERNLNPLFVVCPDLVAQGTASLAFSMSWKHKIPYDKIALVVQDGMAVCDVEPLVSEFQYLFVGGTPAWKWATAKEWIDLAHRNGIPCHIGQAGKPAYIEQAYQLGADSIDSTSWHVNLSYHYIINHRKAHGWPKESTC